MKFEIKISSERELSRVWLQSIQKWLLYTWEEVNVHFDLYRAHNTSDHMVFKNKFY